MERSDQLVTLVTANISGSNTRISGATCHAILAINLTHVCQGEAG